MFQIGVCLTICFRVTFKIVEKGVPLVAVTKLIVCQPPGFHYYFDFSNTLQDLFASYHTCCNILEAFLRCRPFSSMGKGS